MQSRTILKTIPEKSEHNHGKITKDPETGSQQKREARIQRAKITAPNTFFRRRFFGKKSQGVTKVSSLLYDRISTECIHFT